MKDDEDLKDYAGRTILFRPVIIVEMAEDNEPYYRLHLNELDEHLNEPRLFGIVLSDLMDHLAHAYRDVTGRDERDIRAQIMKTLRDEDRFKKKDPSRVQQSGLTIRPQNN
jgi:hypothetical protein